MTARDLAAAYPWVLTDAAGAVVDRFATDTDARRRAEPGMTVTYRPRASAEEQAPGDPAAQALAGLLEIAGDIEAGRPVGTFTGTCLRAIAAYLTPPGESIPWPPRAEIDSGLMAEVDNLTRKYGALGVARAAAYVARDYGWTPAAVQAAATLAPPPAGPQYVVEARALGKRVTAETLPGNGWRWTVRVDEAVSRTYDDPVQHSAHEVAQGVVNLMSTDERAVLAEGDQT